MAKARPSIKVAVGDQVLLGTPGITMPVDWFVATVLLIRGDEIATEHTPAGQGHPRRQFFDRGQVRAAGTYSELRTYQERCREVIDGKRQAVRKAEDALVAARDAVWAELDKIATEIPGAA